MNVSATNSEALQGLQKTTPVDKRMQLQTLLLRKALDAQEQQAAEVTKQMEGKGQIVDLRV